MIGLGDALATALKAEDPIKKRQKIKGLAVSLHVRWLRTNRKKYKELSDALKILAREL